MVRTSYELAADGFATEPRAFHPHVTLARRCRKPGSGAIAVPVAWTVAQLVLNDRIGKAHMVAGPMESEIDPWRKRHAGGRQRLQAIEGRAGVLAGQERLADEGLDDLDAGGQGPSQLAGAIDDGEPLRLALGPWGPLHVNGHGPRFVAGAARDPADIAAYGPGYGEIFRMLSYDDIGPAAMLSRAIGGAGLAAGGGVSITAGLVAPSSGTSR